MIPLTTEHVICPHLTSTMVNCSTVCTDKTMYVANRGIENFVLAVTTHAFVVNCLYWAAI